MMITRVDALKEFAKTITNALKGTSYTVADFEGDFASVVLKKMAVKLGCAPTTGDIHAYSESEVLLYIANNYGTETKEPYDLTVTDTHVTVTVKRNGVTINEGADVLYNGDVLTITATPTTGYDLTTLTVNGNTFVSGNTVTVSGAVTIVATGTIQTFDLERTATDCTVTVTKGGNNVSDGTGVLTYGDVITITAVAGEGKEMTSLTVNGEDFTSGETLTVSDDVEIVGVAETEEVGEG